MSNRIWHTKEDILNDLSEVTGTRVTSIDDKFAVRGKRPPPIIVADEEHNEIVQMYGQNTNRDNYRPEPDLTGIKNMLRMVNNYYDCATHDDNENIKKLNEAASTVISINKIKPNAPAFIPKSEIKIVENNYTSKAVLQNMKSDSSNGEYLVCKDNDEINKTEIRLKTNKTNNNDIDITKKIDVANLNSKDIKDMTEKLKVKIVDTSKANCLKKKRERNLAIASLLKLHTRVPNSQNVKNDVSLKLIAPGYFETQPEDFSKDSITIKTEQNKTFDASSEKENIDIVRSKVIEESAEKVNKWLNGLEKKQHKPSPVFFGQVTFKRKDRSVNSSESPSSQCTDVIEKPPSRQTNSFVPSAYANELTQNYKKQSESKAMENEDMWSKLERQLREKDNTIKEKLASAKVEK